MFHIHSIQTILSLYLRVYGKCHKANTINYMVWLLDPISQEQIILALLAEFQKRVGSILEVARTILKKLTRFLYAVAEADPEVAKKLRQLDDLCSVFCRHFVEYAWTCEKLPKFIDSKWFTGA